MKLWRFFEVLKEQAQAGAIDLKFGDESGFSLEPEVPYTWQPKGTTQELPSSRSKRLNVLGFMGIDSSLDSWVFSHTITSQEVIACIDSLCETLKKETHLILDNASIHHSKKFQECLERWNLKGLVIHFIPPYSPELNLIEILWRKIKYEWLPLDATRSLESLQENLDRVLAQVGTHYNIRFKCAC